MEGGFGFPFGGDPDELMRGLREFAERQTEAMQESQREQFATLTLNSKLRSKLDRTPGRTGGATRYRRFFEDLLAGFDFWVMEPVELIEQDERVVAIVNNRLRPKGGTGGEFDYRNGHIWTIRNGAILSLVGFPSPEEALEAAGLRD